MMLVTSKPDLIPPPPQGKGKGSREGKIGQGGRGRTQGRPRGTTACGGRGSKGRAVDGDRPIGAARRRRGQSTHGDMATPPPPRFGPNPPFLSFQCTPAQEELEENTRLSGGQLT